MTERKNPKDVGRDSPGSRTAREQRIAGTSSGPQEAREEPATPKQPPNRRSKVHEHEPNVRKGYEAAEDPERQGDGDPGPQQLNESPSLQGHAGRSHGGSGRTDDVTERSHSGTPGEGHTREGRQNIPGDRDTRQPQ